jgi:micrococcal nuclease
VATQVDPFGPLTRATIGAALLSLCAATAALSDPCKAIPDKGPMPAHLKPGSTFSGPVSYVGDGDSLCVALGPAPADWVEVRIADFYAAELHEPGGREAKATLERIAKGRRVECVAQHRSYDRVVARCTLQGRSLGSLMRAAGFRKGGNP